ncbi:hypothetical protein ILUMI_14376 [Ignelater luminosus]|uniref:RNA-directed DNA polymerase n=1 Tax=Ignelater luminosus TaxID=2038154 RepID=A0A8K0CUX4_IGNLU|nr:hypothetical protein ILUMI_14376 [Ignelater luminosus]
MFNSEDEDEPKSKSTVERIVANTPNSQSVISTHHFKPQVETEKSLTYKFGDFLDNVLGDRLASGLKNKAIVNKILLKNENLTFANACKLVGDLESVMQSANQFGDNSNAKSANVSLVSHVKSRGRYHQQQNRNVSPKRQSSRNVRKLLVAQKTLLVILDLTKLISLTVDSSHAVGAVLSIDVNDVDCPVVSVSATSTPAQRNYSQLHKKGFAAVIFGLKKFHKYFYGQRFTIYRDHQALKTLFSESKKIPVIAPARINRWAIILSSYNCSIAYRRGTDTPQADLLFPCLVDYKIVSIRSAECPVFHLSRYFKVRNELSWSQGCLVYGNRVVVPKSLHTEALKAIHLNHPGILRSKLLSRSNVWWPTLEAAIHKFLKSCHVCQNCN